MKKKILCLFLMLPALLMTSCLKDQEDLFDQQASIRSAEYLKKAQEILTSSENGWVMNYYPDNMQSYGGYSYVLKFDDKNVTTYFVNGETQTETIDGELTEVPVPETSTYSLTNEDGPVLAFDTYSNYLHYFATPSAGEYEAKGGDFIFIILNISEDQNTITLKGSRSGNLIYLYRNTVTPEQYIMDCMAVVKNQFYEMFAADGVQLELDLESQQASVYIGEETASTSYIITDKGIKFYKPVTIEGKTFDSFTYDAANNTYTPDNNQSLVLEGKLPDGWRSYEDLAGKYQVGESTITVRTNSDGETYSITGFVKNVNGTVTASYKYTKGSFVLSPQYVGKYGGFYYIWLMASSSQYVSWDQSIQLKGKNGTTDPLTITFSSGIWTSLVAGGFEVDPPTGDSYAGVLQDYGDPLTFVRID